MEINNTIPRLISGNGILTLVGMIKARLNSYYTKTETDNKFQLKGNFALRAELPTFTGYTTDELSDALSEVESEIASASIMTLDLIESDEMAEDDNINETMEDNNNGNGEEI